MIRIFSKRKRNRNIEVAPDEIFLDSKNIPKFNIQQFEGRLEKPITKPTIVVLGIIFLLVGIVFSSRLGFLQIAKGNYYFTRSENNVLNKEPVFASRGIIYDRNNVKLAWNEELTGKTFLSRQYIPAAGFSHLLGYVSYPTQDTTGNYWQSEFIGKDGVEKEYNDSLKGINGMRIIETNALGQVQSGNTIDPPTNGKNLNLTIDSRVEEKLYENIKSLADRVPFVGGSGVIMDVTNGEILALTNYPEYSSQVLSLGDDKTAINSYLTDKRKLFINRSISGLYTPGSIVKPYIALGALNEGVIDPLKQILSTGSISIPNPYDPTKETVFKDWRAQGWVDMRHALAVSSDVYFYEIGGGYHDQKGIGILNIEKYTRMFGLAEKTNIDLPGEVLGTIPSPEWKKKNFGGDIWRVGDTYHTSIGQYGFQVTPIQMVRAVAAVANYGQLLRPHVLIDGTTKENNIVSTVDLNREFFDVVREGMRMVVTEGSGSLLNTPDVKVAAKTGTAQVGISKRHVNAWITGFWPYDNPHYAFAVLMEGAISTNTAGASNVIRPVLDWMAVNAPQYLKN